MRAAYSICSGVSSETDDKTLSERTETSGERRRLDGEREAKHARMVRACGPPRRHTWERPDEWSQRRSGSRLARVSLARRTRAAGVEHGSLRHRPNMNHTTTHKSSRLLSHTTHPPRSAARDARSLHATSVATRPGTRWHEPSIVRRGETVGHRRKYTSQERVTAPTSASCTHDSARVRENLLHPHRNKR